MIWVRRIFGVPLGIALLLLLFASLILLRLNDTFLNADFYPERLERADVYQFVMVDVLTLVMDEARKLDPKEFGAGFDGNPIAVYGPATPRIVAAVNRAMTPEDLEELVAPVTLRFGEYAAAERDDLIVTVQVGQHVRAMARELKSLMRDAGTYDLLLDQQVEPRIREALATDESVARLSRYLFGSPEDAVDRVIWAGRRVVTPERIQVQVEQAIDEVTAYLVGESDSFEVRFRLTDAQVEAAVEEARVILREINTYNLLYEQEIEPRIREIPRKVTASNRDVSRWTVYLFGTNEDATDRLIQSIKRVATPQWMEIQVESALDEVVAYLIGESDSFEISFRLTDKQIEAAFEEMKAILREVDAYELVYREIIEPAVRENLGRSVSLGYGVELTEDELVEALRRAAPPAWVQRQAENLIDDVSAYIIGRTDGFLTEVYMVGNKEKAEETLVELADAKLIEAVLDMRSCRTRAEALAAEDSLGHDLPTCIPPGLSVRDVIESVGPGVTGSIRPLALALIPNRVRFTDLNLRTSVREIGGQKALNLLDEGRELLGEGWTYGSLELRADLSKSGRVVETLEDIRALVADGYLYTHEDLHADLARRSGDAVETLEDVRAIIADGYLYTHEYESSDGPASPVVRDLDLVHVQAATVRRYGWVAYVLTPIMLIVIGLLCGRTWPVRIAWASVYLLISAGAAFMAVGPFYDTYFAPGFDRVHASIPSEPGADFENTLSLIADKVLEVSESIRGEFVGGVQQASIVLALASSAALITALLWAPIATAIRGLLRGRQDV